MEFISQFFGTLPAAGQALWSFVDGLYGVAVTLGSVLLAGALLFGAKVWRDDHSWLAATFGVMAAFIAFWWAFGILPSALIYFMDGSRDLLEGTIFPGALPGMDNAYQVTRDILVVTVTAIAIIAFCLASAAVQRTYPRVLVDGEDKGPTSGGYK